MIWLLAMVRWKQEPSCQSGAAQAFRVAQYDYLACNFNPGSNTHLPTRPTRCQNLAYTPSTPSTNPTLIFSSCCSLASFLELRLKTPSLAVEPLGQQTFPPLSISRAAHVSPQEQPLLCIKPSLQAMPTHANWSDWWRFCYNLEDLHKPFLT